LKAAAFSVANRHFSMPGVLAAIHLEMKKLSSIYEDVWVAQT